MIQRARLPLILAGALFLCLDAFAADEAWLKLLHYHSDILFRTRSSIDDPSFFLAPNGNTDPEAEYQATLQAFTENRIIDDQPAACRYPARFDYVQTREGNKFAPQTCERFESWREKLAPKSISVMFASYYLSNPASMYGHTFLKMSRKGYENEGELLDYTINYAAETNTMNGLMFAIKGLAGGYKGRFSTEPYYIKIQKYNNLESRDLWEYKLNLSEEVMDRLVKHLWELGPTQVNYFFFNKNCSYQLLPLLEAADPSLNMSRKHKFRAIPLDTLRSVLKQPGLVESHRIRPSHVQVMMARRALLTPAERDMAEGLLDKDDAWATTSLARLPQYRQALVLDSAFDLLKYRAGFYRNRPLIIKEKEEKILRVRKNIPADAAPVPNFTYKTAPPHEGHKTGRFGLSVGGDNIDHFEEYSVRSAVHDLESDPTGYIQGSQLEMFNLRLRRHDNTNKLTLEELTFIHILSLSPRDPWVHPPSWNVRTGFDVAHEFEKKPDHSLYYGLRGGSGFTVGLPASSFVYAMWAAEADLGSVFRDGYRAGAGGTTGALIAMGRRGRLHVSASALRFGIGHPDNVVRLKAVQTINLSTNLEVRLSGSREEGYHEGMGGLYYYW